MKSFSLTKLSKIIVTVAFSSLVLICTSGITVSAQDNIFDYSGSASSDYVGINIDGSFDDWKDKPMTQINWPWQVDQNIYHQGSVFVDDENIYIYVNMSELSYTGFNGYDWKITVNGKTKPVVVVPPKGTEIAPEGSTDLVVRDQIGYGLIENSMGRVVKSEGKGDVAEIKIPKTFFCDDPDSIQTVQFYSPNLGPQCVTSVSSPTGAVIIAIAGLAIACFGLVKSKKRKLLPAMVEGNRV